MNKFNFDKIAADIRSKQPIEQKISEYKLFYKKYLRNIVKRDDILKELSDIRFVIFHTRFASIGIINNKNCHPFIADKNIICMNGTESAFKDLYNANMTDTETILQFITRQKLDLISSLQELRSAFIGYTNKKVFTIKNDRDLQILKTQGIIIASEFPYDYYVNGNVYNAPALYQEGDQVNYNQLSLAQPNFYLTRKKVI